MGWHQPLLRLQRESADTAQVSIVGRVCATVRIDSLNVYKGHNTWHTTLVADVLLAEGLEHQLFFPPYAYQEYAAEHQQPDDDSTESDDQCGAE
jgi:hypothetical protein